MKILFLSRLSWPHIGGVEKHVYELSHVLEKKGENVKVISEKEINPPHIKLIGLLYIWFWLFINRKLIESADVIHCQDVFIWYLPFRFLYPKKKVYITIHGLEWDRPLNPISLWQKRLALQYSTGSIGVGKFLEKYIGKKFNVITYGAAGTSRYFAENKDKNRIVYVGRLEENTGLLEFLKWLKTSREEYKVDFVGDGRLKEKCEIFGTVHGFGDPAQYYKNAKYCVPGGYLAALEALSAGCEIKLYWSDKVKEDYWKMSPFMDKDVKVWARSQTWEKLADEYIGLYNNTK